MQKRNVLTSPRLSELKKRRRRAVLNKFLFFLLGLSVIFGFLVFLSRLGSLNIAEVEIVGNKVVDAEALKSSALKQMTGKYFWVFPKTNVLYYPEGSIKNELQNKFKILKDINLSIKNGGTLVISLAERIAVYTWCGDVPSETNIPEAKNNQKCYFVDGEGYIFDEAPYFSGEVYFKLYGPADGPLGSFFSKQNFKQLTAFKDTLVNMGLRPIALYKTGEGDVQIFLSKGSASASAVEPKIIFKENSDFQNLAENLEAALSTEPLQSKFKNKYSALQYIDLRFKNKVYDKFLE